MRCGMPRPSPARGHQHLPHEASKCRNQRRVRNFCRDRPGREHRGVCRPRVERDKGDILDARIPRQGRAHLTPGIHPQRPRPQPIRNHRDRRSPDHGTKLGEAAYKARDRERFDGCHGHDLIGCPERTKPGSMPAQAVEVAHDLFVALERCRDVDNDVVDPVAADPESLGHALLAQLWPPGRPIEPREHAERTLPVLDREADALELVGIEEAGPGRAAGGREPRAFVGQAE